LAGLDQRIRRVGPWEGLIHRRAWKNEVTEGLWICREGDARMPMLCIMNATDPLPGDLSRSGFRFDAAIAAGVPRQHLYRVELQRPFHRMRCIDVDLDDHPQLCTALACLLPPGAFFSHRSAAIIHGLPVPRSALPPTPEISVFEPDRPPEISGVSAHQLTYSGQRSSSIEGLQVIGPEDAWAQLSASLSVIELVVVGDMLITGSEPYSGTPPLSDSARLADAVRRHGRRRGVRSLRTALERVRYGRCHRRNPGCGWHWRMQGFRSLYSTTASKRMAGLWR
jgi:hypothetical protein